jgi:hypothetical protein
MPGATNASEARAPRSRTDRRGDSDARKVGLARAVAQRLAVARVAQVVVREHLRGPRSHVALTRAPSSGRRTAASGAVTSACTQTRAACWCPFSASHTHTWLGGSTLTPARPGAIASLPGVGRAVPFHAYVTGGAPIRHGRKQARDAPCSGSACRGWG